MWAAIRFLTYVPHSDDDIYPFAAKSSYHRIGCQLLQVDFERPTLKSPPRTQLEKDHFDELARKYLKYGVDIECDFLPGIEHLFDSPIELSDLEYVCKPNSFARVRVTVAEKERLIEEEQRNPYQSNTAAKLFVELVVIEQQRSDLQFGRVALRKIGATPCSICNPG